jgi:hypothetical protein
MYAMYGSTGYTCTILILHKPGINGLPRVHRVATAAFWRSFMRVKLALAGVGGGARPPPFITFISKVAVYAPAEWADTLTLFHP